MSVLRRRLLMGGGRGRYVDEFAALSGRWLPQAGSLAVAGGALQAATLGDWLGNLTSNGEFTTDTAGWSASQCSLARVDSETDPGVDSGGLDAWVVKTTATSDGAAVWAYQTISSLVGGRYRANARVYPVSGGEETGRLRITCLGTTVRDKSVADTWQDFDTFPILLSSGTTIGFYLQMGPGTTTTGYVLYWDSVVLYRQNAPALLAGWRSPNHVATLSHVSPAVAGNATDYVPFGYICRYTDSLNYWEVRVVPNTVGNDLQIIQVTDGAETTRAESDIDWTSDDTDELRVRCAGATISTEHRKSGESGWTAGPSYASATQGQDRPQLGVMLYETGVGRLAGFDIRAI